MKKTDLKIQNLFSKISLFILFLLILFMTRISHELTSFSLPDASLICFIAGGLFLKRFGYCLVLLLTLFFIDIYAITSNSFSEITLGSSYLIHMVTYFFAWQISKKLLSIHYYEISKFFLVISLIIFGAYIFSYGSYYFLNNIANESSLFIYIAQDLKHFLLINYSYGTILFICIKLTNLIVGQNNSKSSLLNN